MKAFSWRLCAFLLLVCLLSGALLASCKREPQTEEDAAASVTFSDSQTLTFSARLDGELYQAYRKQELSLYACSPDDPLDSVAGKTPVALGTLSSEQVEFTFSASASDGASRDLLYATYLLAAPDGTVLLPPVGVTNASAYAPNQTKPQFSNRIKGVSAADMELARSLYAAHTSLRISASMLISGDGSASVSLFGTSLFLNNDTVAFLDARIRSASNAGLSVVLSFLPDAELSLSAYAALLDFLAGRYYGGEYGLISALVIEQAAECTAQAPQTDAAAKTAELARLSALALTSRYANGQVYLKVSGETDAVKSYLIAVNRLTEPMGITPGVAFAPDAAVESMTEEQSPRMLLSSLIDLAKLLRRELGGGVRFAMFDLKIPAQDPHMQAALVTYACRVATEMHVDFMMYGALADDAVGLYSADLTERAAARAFRLADTNANSEGEQLAKTLLADDWKRLGNSVRASRTQIEEVANLGTTEDSGKRWFDFSDENAPEFSVAGRGSAPARIPSAGFSTEVLASSLELTENGLASGYRTVFANADALKGAYVLTVRLLGQTPPALSASHAKITLQLEGTAADGSALSYSSGIKLSCNAWQTVSFRVQEYTERMDPEKPCSLTLLMLPCDEKGIPIAYEHEGDRQSFALWLHSVNVRRAGSDLTTPLVLGLAVLGFAAGLAAVVIAARIKRRRSSSKPNGRRS